MHSRARRRRGLVSGGPFPCELSVRRSSSAGQPRHPHPALHKHAFPQLQKEQTPFPTDVCAGIDREASSSPSNSWGVRAIPPRHRGSCRHRGSLPSLPALPRCPNAPALLRSASCFWKHGLTGTVEATASKLHHPAVASGVTPAAQPPRQQSAQTSAQPQQNATSFTRHFQHPGDRCLLSF